jgi:hypothetical protein
MAISIADLIKQNTLGQSEGFPLGVPTSYNWYQGWNGEGMETPPANFTAVAGWGQVYQEVGKPADSNPNATVQVANAQTYVHIKATGQWVLVENQSTTQLTGGHFATDFAGNTATTMTETPLAGGGVSFDAPSAGYNDHFWHTSRGTYSAGTVDAVYVQMDMRVTDPNAHLVAMVGADWWRDSSAPFLPDHSNNPGIGGSNWVELSTQWQTVGYYSMSTAQFEADLPPPLVGSSAQSAPAVSPDTLAPAAPQITAFTPDTGTVGDKVTDASVLTLTGTAEAGSTVNLFDGTTAIGTVKASASGAWSLTTADMSSGVHSFSAKATDAAGNTSSASSPLSVTVNPSTQAQTSVTSNPPTQTSVTSPPASASNNLLVNGSFESASLSALDGGRWGAFSSIPGWTAISGSKIELWSGLENVKASDGANYGELDYLGAQDGFYQDVKTVAGQKYDLSFDARSRPGFDSSTTTMEVLWNGSVVATVPPGDSWQNYDFTVIGTGGQDRLTFRELAGQSADGLGALYDNVSLTPDKSAPATTQAATSSTATATGANLLVNGSFESSTLAADDTGRWGAFSSVPGWTAISGSAIELWSNLNGVDATNGKNFGELDYQGAQDGFYQDVKTVAGQNYDLSFDARSRPGFDSSTTSMEVLWNGSVVATVPPGDSWQNYDFTVVGTGGQDRLTFREVAGQGSDGLGALYDNVALVAKPANTTSSTSVASVADQSVNLMKQFAATSLTGTSSASTAVTGTSTNTSQDQTLASAHH